MTNKNLSDKSNDKLADELPLRILIAEDNVINQKLLLNILAILGYKAEAVADGLDVLRSLNEKKIDLVLMDIQMPEMGGEETTRLIRERFTDNAPKIIAITADAMAGDREKYLKAGMDGYIAKPFKMADLVAELRRVMSAKE